MPLKLFHPHPPLVYLKPILWGFSTLAGYLDYPGSFWKVSLGAGRAKGGAWQNCPLKATVSLELRSPSFVPGAVLGTGWNSRFPCLQRRIEVCMRRFRDPWRFCCVAKPWSILMNFFDGQDSKCVTDCLVFLKIGFFPTSFNPSSCTKVIIPHIISVLGTNSALWLLNYANSHLYMASHCWPLSS